ncbi:VWA domain-containing protein [Pseudomaricurvus sp. HS19]|uniref:vWA domain-containing protein n=1 Tax=Pseudomaricurvus sp. HS19 TaxID=2692626 RepID=UPI00136CFED2|nr:vWA domain-containing protein [Pseudomaricurvus sp. HS19]MYM64772.1 VWA domain-containing protein [Pseudomaricurvus sp. HS19]
MKLKNREINIFSMSALDLFASGMGAFILLAVIALPFFTNISKVPAAGPQVCPEPIVCPKPVVCMTCPPPEPGFKKLPDLDFVVVLDISGSMDDELNGLRAEIGGVAALLDKLAESSYIRIVPFGDAGFDVPVSNQFPLTPTKDLAAVQKVLNQVKIDMGMGSGRNISGNGESVYPGFAEALDTGWRSGSKNKVIVIMTDDKPHPGDNQRLLSAVDTFAARNKGNKVSVIYTGTDADQETFYKTVSQRGNGDLIVQSKGMTTLTSSLILSLFPK